MFFQNEQCYFLWKPSEIASTRGEQHSFLDVVFIDQKWATQDINLERFLSEIEKNWITLSNIDIKEFVPQQMELFTQEQEFGLLNRLDTATSGLLYFAKTPEIYKQWKDRQKQWHISKHYIAQIEKEITPKTIDTPLAHHTNGKRMIVATQELLSSKRKQKIKGKLLPSETNITKISKTNEDIFAHIIIHKGRRHQIRAHLASIWTPIVWEQLYSDSLTKQLQLFSIWCTINTT